MLSRKRKLQKKSRRKTKKYKKPRKIRRRKTRKYKRKKTRRRKKKGGGILKDLKKLSKRCSQWKNCEDCLNNQYQSEKNCHWYTGTNPDKLIEGKRCQSYAKLATYKNSKPLFKDINDEANRLQQELIKKYGEYDARVKSFHELMPEAMKNVGWQNEGPCLSKEEIKNLSEEEVVCIINPAYCELEKRMIKIDPACNNVEELQKRINKITKILLLIKKKGKAAVAKNVQKFTNDHKWAQRYEDILNKLANKTVSVGDKLFFGKDLNKMTDNEIREMVKLNICNDLKCANTFCQSN